MIFFKIFRWFAPLCLALVALTATAQDRTLRVVLESGQRFDVVVAQTTPMTLPMQAVNAATGERVKLKLNEVFSLELLPGSPAVDGVRRWQTLDVATPSVLLGKRHVARTLVGLVACLPDSSASVYRWVSTVKAGGTARFCLNYGLCFNDGGYMLYPFIQDSRVWLRDLELAFGKSHAAEVAALQRYYVQPSASEAKARQAELRQSPASILQHLR